MVSSYLKPTLLPVPPLILTPFSAFALPTTNPSYKPTQLASRQDGQVHAAQYDKNTGEIVCMKTGNPNKCKLRITSTVDTNTWVTVYDHDCKALSWEYSGKIQGPNDHWSIFSELRYTVDLFFQSGNWNDTPLLKYSTGIFGAPLGNAICVNTRDSLRQSCLIPFDC
ncbi:uncharacterized protein PAC_10370 [Phialocephala subalpina]|uniref:Uncharacterized protein n=1 Tax=Phialocephala subalpina TaxID=576137 RepID=A0A1L7X653_9HELO|nr:uncharacterized protein PAC_10370 [Phialocephala subalpina]